MAIRMDLVTMTITVTSDLDLENITPDLQVTVGEGVPPAAGIAAGIGALKSALIALEAEGAKYGIGTSEGEE